MAAIAQARYGVFFHQIHFTSWYSSNHFAAAKIGAFCLPFRDRQILPLLQSSGYSFPGGSGNLVSDRKRIWNGDLYEDDLEDEEKEGDRILDLLVNFMQNLFTKISKKARKSVPSVLPVSIPTELVVCTLGTMVFVSILLIRGIWSGITCIQQSRANRMNALDGEQLWNSTRPAMRTIFTNTKTTVWISADNTLKYSAQDTGLADL